MENENTQVAIIENSIEVLKTGPQILQAAQIRKDRAIAVGTNILNEIEEKGMDATLDERAMNYLANVTKAGTEMKEQRAAVTQIMDVLKKMYTEVENQLDPKKDGTIPAKIQNHRNKFATDEAKRKAEIKRKAEEAAAKQKEAIDIRAQMETNYLAQASNFLTNRKSAIQTSFNAITLDNFEEKSKALSALTFSYSFKADGPYVSSRVIYHSNEELKAIADAVIIDNEQDCANNYMAEMNILKDDLVEKLPSKLSELKQQKQIADDLAKQKAQQEKEAKARQEKIEKANKEEKEKLEKEQKAQQEENQRQNKLMLEKQQQLAAEQEQREQEQALKLEQENQQRIAQSEQTANIKKLGEQTMVLFEAEAAVAEVGRTAEARQGVEIKILHPVAYVEIFTMWFDKEGKDMPIDKLDNVSLGKMRAWAEKRAHKENVKIESKFLVYEETFKAVNRSVKK